MINVNLVFHGVYAFVLNHDDIDVLIPYFAPHQYLFGSWASDQRLPDLEPLPKAFMKIEGLNGVAGCRPKYDFDPKVNVTAHNLVEESPESENKFAALKLPVYPTSVHHFRLYQHPDGPSATFPFHGVHGSGNKLNKLAGPTVLTYSADDPDEVEIQFQILDRYKPLKFARHIAEDTLNVHFFSEGDEHELPRGRGPERDIEAGAHFGQMWPRLTSMIAQLDITLKELSPFVLGDAPTPPQDTYITGLPRTQLAELDELGRIGRAEEVVFGGQSDCNTGHALIDNRPAL